MGPGTCRYGRGVTGRGLVMTLCGVSGGGYNGVGGGIIRGVGGGGVGTLTEEGNPAA